MRHGYALKHRCDDRPDTLPKSRTAVSIRLSDRIESRMRPHSARMLEPEDRRVTRQRAAAAMSLIRSASTNEGTGMKLALISSPRGGNTWLRMIVADCYGLQQRAVHTPDAVDWSALPDQCIVQMHWRYDDRFAAMLAEQRIQIITISRHPLDVLLSIWQFAPHEPQTMHWLAGEGGDESSLIGREVASDAFLEYATGPRAAALLSVTAEWWHIDGVIRVRYEDLVADPHAALRPMTDRLGAVVDSIDDVLARLTIDKLRKTSTNNHFWRGQPGHWRTLIPRERCEAIERAHSGVFESLGYSV